MQPPHVMWYRCSPFNLQPSYFLCSRPYPTATTRCTSDLVIGTDLLVLQCGSALPHLVPELACPGTKVDQVFQAGQSAA